MFFSDINLPLSLKIINICSGKEKKKKEWNLPPIYLRRGLVTSHVSVSSGCCNNIPPTGQLQQQRFISRGSGGWEVQDRCASHSSFW